MPVTIDVGPAADMAVGRLRHLLESGKLTQEEFDIVSRATNRMVEHGIAGPLESPAQRSGRETDIAADLATLTNVGVAKGLDLESDIRTAATIAVKWVINFGLRMIAPVVVSGGV